MQGVGLADPVAPRGAEPPDDPIHPINVAHKDERDPAVCVALREAVVSRADAERSIKGAVEGARRHDSWVFIGKINGTSGDASRLPTVRTSRTSRTSAVVPAAESCYRIGHTLRQALPRQTLGCGCQEVPLTLRTNLGLP